MASQPALPRPSPFPPGQKVEPVRQDDVFEHPQARQACEGERRQTFPSALYLTMRYCGTQINDMTNSLHLQGWHLKHNTCGLFFVKTFEKVKTSVVAFIELNSLCLNVQNKLLLFYMLIAFCNEGYYLNLMVKFTQHLLASVLRKDFNTFNDPYLHSTDKGFNLRLTAFILE